MSTDAKAPSRSQKRAAAIKNSGGVMSHRQIMFVLYGMMAGMYIAWNPPPQTQ